MTELFDEDAYGPVSSGGEEGWEVDSDSDAAPPGRGNKRTRQTRVIRPVAEVLDGEDHRVYTPVDEDDELLGQYVNAASKKQKHQHSDSYELLGSDDPGDGAAAAAVAAAADPSSRSAENGITASTALLSEAGRAAAERERSLRQELEGIKRAAEEPDEESDELEPSQPPTVHRAAAEVEDLTFDLDDIVGSDDGLPGAAATPAETEGGDAAKVALKFNTEGHENVLVRLHPADPLSKAMSSFGEYVQQQGWGAVSHFMSPDGDKLTGDETIQSLDLEQGDIIEVHLVKQ